MNRILNITPLTCAKVISSIYIAETFILGFNASIIQIRKERNLPFKPFSFEGLSFKELSIHELLFVYRMTILAPITVSLLLYDDTKLKLEKILE